MADNDGYGPDIDADAEFKKTVLALKDAAETFSNASFEMFNAIKYKEKQVPNGLKYIIKVHVNTTRTGYIHMMTFKENSKPVQTISGIQQNKTADDKLTPF